MTKGVNAQKNGFRQKKSDENDVKNYYSKIELGELLEK